MDLHELHTGAEWYAIPAHKRTKLQRLAARTLGIVTPGNVVTLLGLIITAAGLWAFGQAHYLAGFLLISFGRVCDILDGHIARRTHTSGPFGEGLDAATDKVIILLAGVVLLVTHAVPTPLLVAIMILEAATALVVLLGRRKGIKLHPLRIGKYATFALWFALSAYLLAHALGSRTDAGHVLYVAATVCGVAALSAATYAFVRYVRLILHR